MPENQTFLAPLLPFWEKGLGDEGRISVYAFALEVTAGQTHTPTTNGLIDKSDTRSRAHCHAPLQKHHCLSISNRKILTSILFIRRGAWQCARRSIDTRSS
jgi:hypothetical protein